MSSLIRAFRRAAIAALVTAPGLRAQQPAGRLIVDTLHSKALEGNLYGDSPNRSMAVYLPQTYDASPSKRYPVVYLLHGFGGNEQEWVTLAPLKPAMDTLVRAGAVREMIIVMPNGKNAIDGSFYTNSTTTGNWDDFISKELVSYIDAKYRTLARPESRGLAGHSMGGYGTFTLGMRHAGDVYGALYSLSGCCTRFARTTNSPQTWDAIAAVPSVAEVRRISFLPKVMLAMSAAFSPDSNAKPLFTDLPFVYRDGKWEPVDGVYARWVEHAPYDMIAGHADKLKKLRGFMFDVGLSDQLVSPASQAQMDSALTRAGVKHTFETYDGDHTNRIAVRLSTRLLPFFSQTLDFGDAPRR
ncbi:MAG TPA: alpha/beta hydrolase-fold protein [Gemmatimonadaceae bacterium]|nr:alpha/beta hydrolase-fold protein [Gemmatimonadaceae bacterium]